MFIQSRYSQAQPLQFEARFKNLSPRKQAIITGMTTAAGGTATVGSEGVAIANGHAPSFLNLAVGLWNAWVGTRQINNNGGVKGLKDPH